MWHRVVVGALVLLLVGIGEAGAASLRATFESFLDRLAWLLRSGPGDATRAELRSWEPAPGGARAASELQLDLFGPVLPVPLVHAVRETITGVRITTRLDAARLSPDVRGVLEALLPDYRDLVLDVTLPADDRWDGELRLPALLVEDPDMSGGIGESRLAFTLSFGPGERFAGSLRLEMGRVWGADEDGRFDATLAPVDVRFETLRYHLGVPLIGTGEIGGEGGRFTVGEEEGASELRFGPFRLVGGTSLLDGERTRVGLGFDLAFGRLVVPDEEPVGPGRIRFDFALEAPSVRLLERLIEVSGTMDPFTAALVGDPTRLGREVTRDILGRAGRLTLSTTVDYRDRRALAELDLRWPAPRRALATMGDWLELVDGRLRLDIPLDLVEDPELQQSLAAPVAMGLATVREGRVQADLRITGGMVLGGAQPQPLAALLGDVVTMPLDVPAR